MSSDSAGKKTGAPTAGSGLEAASERKYLTWYNKVGYGSGDVAGNVVYVLLSAFVMIYLTDTAGLNAGVVGTLMMVSRLFDGWTAPTRGWVRPARGCCGGSWAAPP